MDDRLHGLDTKRVIARIRESLKPKLGSPSGRTLGAVAAGDDGLRDDVAVLHGSWDVYYFALTSHRKLVGGVIVFFKRLGRMLLKPVLLRQSEYNTANTRVVQWLLTELTNLRQAVATERAEREARQLQATIRDGDAGDVGDALTGLLRDVLAAARERSTAGAERHERYLHYFEGREPALVLGCDGAALCQRLHEAGIKVAGVDVDLDAFLTARERGLDVVEADPLRYLEGVTEDSLGAIFVADAQEQIASGRLLALVQLARQKLKPGGVLILDVVNPLWEDAGAALPRIAIARARPFHPATMRFVLEMAGFTRVVLDRLGPDLDSAARSTAPTGTDLPALAEALFGLPQYGLVARKPAADGTAG